MVCLWCTLLSLRNSVACAVLAKYRHINQSGNPTQGGVSENTSFSFYYAIYYAILFFTTLFTTLREAPANDLYVFWQVPNRQYGVAGGGYICMRIRQVCVGKVLCRAHGENQYRK